MSAGAPWSVKGIDPKAREVAKDLARRSGMTLGEWLNRVILEDDVPEDVTSEEHFTDRPQRASTETPRPRLVSSQPAPTRTDDLARIAYALDRLTDRIESSETRTGLAISGVEHSVRAAVARIETAEREHVAVATRLVDDQQQLADRMRRVESDAAGPRSAEALRAIEQTVSRVAGQAYETREALAAMEQRLQQGAAFASGDPSAVIEEVVARLGARLADAEARTALALEGLRGSLADLDGRLHGVERGGPVEAERKLEALAASLADRVEAARNEIAEKLKATPAGRVDERFAELAAQVQAAEQRSAEAIDRMGRELLSVAEAFNRRVQASEQRSAEAIAKVGGEMVRIAGAVEDRLGRAEQVQAEALEKLGGDIAKITERLTDRMLQSERRTAQAIDDVGEQVSKVTERLEQRHERAAADVAERLRQSEERTQRLLDEARERLDHGLAPARPAAETDPPLKSTAAFGPALFSRAESEEDAAPPAPAAAPTFADADFEDDDREVGFAPIPEPDEDDIFGLDQPQPPKDETEERPLSTREVIEAARANARAVEGSRPKLQVKAKHNWRAAPKPPTGVFGAAKARPKVNSTLQTAFMIVGGAAALSVGAAGMVLINETANPQAVESSPFGAPPRAAIAITPQPLGPTAPQPSSEAQAEVAAAPAQSLAEQFSVTVREVEAGKPGALAKLKTIAEAGYTPAQFHLATLYENGQGGVVKNLPEARRWTIRAAEGGERMAMYNLGLDYFYGQGGPQDLAAAARWFRKAAERGLTDAQYNLGMLYQAGSGVERDLTEAYRWFSIAAQGGDAPARESAVSLEAKLSPTQIAQVDRAVKGFKPAGAAPEVTVASAQKILGRLGYYKGQATGTPSRDFKVAVQAYQRDQGLAATGALDPVTSARLSVFTR